MSLGAPALPGRSGWDVFALCAVIVAVALRLGALLANHPLGLDETMVALNIMSRSYATLLQPLDYDQAAPPLFLWVARFAGTLGAGSELALRSVPFLAGIGVLFATWWYARSVYSREVAAASVVLVAVSRILIDYSVDLKPYAGDAAVSALLLALAWQVATRQSPARRWWLALGGCGVVALGASYTAPLVLAAAGIIASAGCLRSGRIGRAWAPLLALAVIWLGTFAVLYPVVFEPPRDIPYMGEFWRESFLAGADSPRTAIWLFASVVLQPLPDLIGGVRIAILLPAVMATLWLASREFGWWPLVPLGAICGLLVAVSGLALYPLHGRLVLFVAPVFLTAMGAGLVAGLRRVSDAPKVRGMATAGVGLIAALALYLGPQGAPGRSASRISGIEIMLQAPDSAAVFIVAAGGPKWVYYTTDWVTPDTARLAWYARELSWGGSAFRDARDPEVVTNVPAAPLSPPGSRREFLARSSGSSHTSSGRPVPGWAEAELGGLAESDAREVWMYAGLHHRRELPELLDAAAGRGFSTRELHRSAQDVVVVLTRTDREGANLASDATPRP